MSPEISDYYPNVFRQYPFPKASELGYSKKSEKMLESIDQYLHEWIELLESQTIRKSWATQKNRAIRESQTSWKSRIMRKKSSRNELEQPKRVELLEGIGLLDRIGDKRSDYSKESEWGYWRESSYSNELASYVLKIHMLARYFPTWPDQFRATSLEKRHPREIIGIITVERRSQISNFRGENSWNAIKRSRTRCPAILPGNVVECNRSRSRWSLDQSITIAIDFDTQRRGEFRLNWNETRFLY